MKKEMFVKVIELMVAIGYNQKQARSQATAQMKKLAVINSEFEDAKYRKGINVLTEEEASILIELISQSKSKYKEGALKLMETGLPEAILTEDDAWRPAETKVKKPRKPDLVEFIQAQGLWDEFNEWYKASKIEA